MTKTKTEMLVDAYEHHSEKPWRLCKVDGKDGVFLFHMFYVSQWTHGASVTIGGFCAGQESHPRALIEDDRGNISIEDAYSIKFMRGD